MDDDLTDFTAYLLLAGRIHLLCGCTLRRYQVPRVSQCACNSRHETGEGCHIIFGRARISFFYTALLDLIVMQSFAANLMGWLAVEGGLATTLLLHTLD